MPPSVVILRIVGGPAFGRTLDVPPRGSLVIGRSHDVSAQVDDPALSRKHFELLLEGEHCSLVDAGSTNGTRVNGAVVAKVVLVDGDRIEAGASIFLVEIGAGGAVSPEHAAHASSPENHAHADTDASNEVTASTSGQASAAANAAAMVAAVPIEIFAHVDPIEQRDVGATTPPDPGSQLAELTAAVAQREGLHLYAIVDGATAVELAVESRIRWGCRLLTLFDQSLLGAAHAGPILFEIPARAPFLRRWCDTLGKASGLLIQAEAEAATLHAHLRSVFHIRGESGEPAFLRFYDPRVLRGWLSLRNADERRMFFGPIVAILAEDEKGERFEAVTPEFAAAEGTA